LNDSYILFYSHFLDNGNSIGIIACHVKVCYKNRKWEECETTNK